jgi:hypothetical protein
LASNNHYGKKATDMAAAPICMSCNLERTLISIKPANNRHDMLQYECPQLQKRLPPGDAAFAAGA